MLYDLLRRFQRDTRGAIAIIFGLVFILLVGVVGGAVDYAQWTSARSATQNAIDAAVLAAGRQLQLPNTTEAQAVAAAQKYYDENKSNLLQPDNVSFTVGPRRTEIVATTASSAVRTPFLAVLGITELPVDIKATAKLAAGANSGSNVEISMMLDITGSMKGTKIADLKAAAKDLVDIVVWSDQSTFTSRVAIAPFSPYVNVGTAYFSAVTGESTPNSDKTCVMERDSNKRYLDDKPNAGHYFEAYDDDDACKTAGTIMPLSNNKSALRTHIDGLTTGGRTAGHLGTAWAWYLLSPKWDTIWPAESQPQAYNLTTQYNEQGNPKLYKIAILMTDGKYNEEYSGPNSTTQARTLCTNMKAEGLTVYTVGFGIAVDSTPDVTMQQCATSPTHYYNAVDGDALKNAFRDIALKILTLRLSD